MDNNDLFQWTKFYMEFAGKLLLYKNDRQSLLNLLKNVFDEVGIKFPYTENGEIIYDICPFTVFGAFNRGIKDENRIAIITALKNRLEMSSMVPSSFEGIPVLNNMKTWFFSYKKDQGEKDIDNLWRMFEYAIKYSDTPSADGKSDFIEMYDIVLKQNNVKWNLTMALYWCRPYTYINLDNRNRKFVLEDGNLPHYFQTVFAGIDKKMPDGNKYLFMCEQCSNAISKGDFGYMNLPELSYIAWQDTIKKGDKKSNAEFLKWFAPIISAIKKLGGKASPKDVREQIAKDMNLSKDELNEKRGKTNTNKFANEVAFARNYLAYEGIIDKSERGIWALTQKGMSCDMTEQLASDIFRKWVEVLKSKREADEKDLPVDEQVHFWVYAAGENSRLWDEFYQEKIMAIGWDELGDLSDYVDREEMRTALKQKGELDKAYKNDSLATWQFVNTLKIGDIVYVKRGLSKIVGRGIVKSEYHYDELRKEYKNTRAVEWTNKGEFEHPGQAVMKTLTDVTQYTEYVLKLEEIFSEDTGTVVDLQKEIEYAKYTEEDFMNNVFMDESSYEQISRLLLKKKNIILQGAPGVGKTYAAKRLAYSIMKVKDTSRVMMVQFHQSYSYEDFVMGYRPAKEGFELSAGPFYEFCKKAQDDEDREYFFIIDEINRGNLSKIFGELLMLIETDKRGESLRLLYSNELFMVPSNVYIIGMMNTADRSLAMIDYALRRRFAFFELKPAFTNEKFDEMKELASNYKFDKLIDIVVALNKVIENDDSLGAGFVVGHSYFCISEPVLDSDLSAIVEFELLPLLREYWFDEQSKIAEWEEKLRGALND
ncbi:AAA family ATPase [Sedimentibacter sp. zth1]|uniref:AAA family ATPase n=1 Tax=Sedimentibacter sp. zth1 TaxID=2816908 RepID=UPI001A919A64|nr:AAA family ATPase [Sedimentibacter sp. zth1]QSX05598.1 AAA family ATPase [Sedimentibacter sp. zth1]